jgi:hypothetical protein
MQYMLLCYADEKGWAALGEEGQAAILDEYAAWAQAIVKSGHYRASARLGPTAAATTLREAHGKRLTLDGPFAETKEQLGGFHLVECRDLDEALAIARRIPTLRAGGVVEVRPVERSSEP